MNKLISSAVLFFVLLFKSGAVGAQVLDAPMWDESTELNINDLKTYRQMFWDTLKDDMAENEMMLRETAVSYQWLLENIN